MTTKKGMRHPLVAEVRRRFNLAIPAGPAVFAFDDAVEAAVKTFQERVGLPVSGEIDDATLTALRSS